MPWSIVYRFEGRPATFHARRETGEDGAWKRPSFSLGVAGEMVPVRGANHTLRHVTLALGQLFEGQETEMTLFPSEGRYILGLRETPDVFAHLSGCIRALLPGGKLTMLVTTDTGVSETEPVPFCGYKLDTDFAGQG